VGFYNYLVHQSVNVLVSQVLVSSHTGCIAFTPSSQALKVMSFWTE